MQSRQRLLCMGQRPLNLGHDQIGLTDGKILAALPPLADATLRAMNASVGMDDILLDIV